MKTRNALTGTLCILLLLLVSGCGTLDALGVDAGVKFTRVRYNPPAEVQADFEAWFKFSPLQAVRDFFSKIERGGEDGD